MATTSNSSSEANLAAADREILISRIISAPREVVFEAFTQVRHLSRWWGPDGFSTTTRSFEFRPGGVWDFVMHGPDGTDYQEWITWREIVPVERIVLLHGESRGDPDAFESVLTFDPVGDETQIVMQTVFPTKELRDEAVERYHAVAGGEQTLRNLAAYVAESAREESARSVADAREESARSVAADRRPGGPMSRVRVHNFSISLDGFGVGEHQRLEEPFGHAGRRLVEWAVQTRTFQDMGLHGDVEGSTGIDEAFASRWGRGVGVEIMGRNKFAPKPGPWPDDEWRGWWGDTRRPHPGGRPHASCASRRWRWTAARRSTSSTRPRQPHSSKHVDLRAISTSASAVAPPRSGPSSRPT